MTKAIGGYFSIELGTASPNQDLHTDALHLNTGRNCLEYILKARKYKKVYIPYYTCSVVLEPFEKLAIEYEYYHIDSDFYPTQLPQLEEGDAFLYTNYYDLCRNNVEKLAKSYGNRLIVDNTQAYYMPRILGIDSFNTCRKFFGVADGANLYTDCQIEGTLSEDMSHDRMHYLLQRYELGSESAYAEFREESHKLIGQPIKAMSALTTSIMQRIDYQQAADRRLSNYKKLHAALSDSNELSVVPEKGEVPMIYPYLVKDSELRVNLIKNKIFVARYWPNVDDWAEEGSYERYLTDHLIPLPIDQRYGDEDMNRIIETIKNII